MTYILSTQKDAAGNLGRFTLSHRGRLAHIPTRLVTGLDRSVAGDGVGDHSYVTSQIGIHQPIHAASSFPTAETS